MKDARKKLSELSQMIGMTLPAAKYRFDNLARRGFLQDYVIQVLPYPPEISDLYEVRLDFGEHKAMIAKENFLKRLPFVLNYSRIKGTNSITIRVYLPRTEVNNLLTLLSALGTGALWKVTCMPSSLSKADDTFLSSSKYSMLSYRHPALSS